MVQNATELGVKEAATIQPGSALPAPGPAASLLFLTCAGEARALCTNDIYF